MKKNECTHDPRKVYRGSHLFARSGSNDNKCKVCPCQYTTSAVVDGKHYEVCPRCEQLVEYCFAEKDQMKKTECTFCGIQQNIHILDKFFEWDGFFEQAKTIIPDICPNCERKSMYSRFEKADYRVKHGIVTSQFIMGMLLRDEDNGEFLNSKFEIICFSETFVNKYYRSRYTNMYYQYSPITNCVSPANPFSRDLQGNDMTHYTFPADKDWKVLRVIDESNSNSDATLLEKLKKLSDATGNAATSEEVAEKEKTATDSTSVVAAGKNDVVDPEVAELIKKFYAIINEK